MPLKNVELVKLGHRIRRARKLLGFSQKDFSAKCGLDRSYLGGVERGNRNVTFGVLCTIELEGMLQNTSHFLRDSRRTCDCHDRMAIDLQDFIGAIVHHDIACRSPSISRPGILKLKMVVAVVSTKSERLPGLEGISLISRRCFRTVRKSPASGFA
jgi:transcriptional regulator with XRE-family HTH domain